MIYMLGGSGAPNYGDELILHHWLRYTAQRFASSPGSATPEAVIVDNNNARNSVELFGARYPHSRFVSVLKRLRHPRPGSDFLANLRYGAGFFSQGRFESHPEVVALMPDLERTRLLHIYGGGYINTTISPEGALLLGLAADAKRVFGMRVVATGLGLSPLVLDENAPTAALAETVEAFDLLETRDHPSFQQLRQAAGPKAAILCGHDDSLLYPMERDPRRTGHRKLHLSGFKGGNMFERPETTAQLQREAQRFDEVIYWRCAPRTEDAVVASVSEKLPGVRVADVEELLFDGLPVDEGDYMLTMRFHPHIVAARLGCSGQYWAASTYYTHKHGSVVQLGSRFAKYQPSDAPFDAVEQPIAWREPMHNAMKQALADKIYGMP